MNFRYLTEAYLKAEEEEANELNLKQKIKIKDIIIKTYGELRPYIKSTKIARKFKDFLDDEDFEYFFNWILDKEIDMKIKSKL